MNQVPPINRREQEERFVRDFHRFQELAAQTKPRFRLSTQEFYPCLDDKSSATEFDRHYIYHTAWAMACLQKIHPSEHHDFSSSLYFSALLSASTPVIFYDIRPPELSLPRLQVKKENLQSLTLESQSLQSVSCMHVVEHIGLGRYGDEIDYDGDLKAISELKRVTAPGGNLLFVVPIGQDAIQFNAHRIYSYAQVSSLFEGFHLHEFALIPDDSKVGHLMVGASESLANQQRYGCGCFWWKRPVVEGPNSF